MKEFISAFINLLAASIIMIIGFSNDYKFSIASVNGNCRALL